MKAESKNTIKLIAVSTIGGAILGLVLSLVLVFIGVWSDKMTTIFATAACALVAPVIVWELKIKKPQVEAAAAVARAKAEKTGPTPEDLGAKRVTHPYDEKFEDWASRNLFGPGRNRAKGGALILDLWLVPDGRGLELKQALRGSATLHFTELCDGYQVVATADFMS